MSGILSVPSAVVPARRCLNLEEFFRRTPDNDGQIEENDLPVRHLKGTKLGEDKTMSLSGRLVRNRCIDKVHLAYLPHDCKGLPRRTFQERGWIILNFLGRLSLDCSADHQESGLGLGLGLGFRRDFKEFPLSRSINLLSSNVFLDSQPCLWQLRPLVK